jgi:hypothetical protein
VTAVEHDGEVVTVRANREDRDQSRIAAFELARTDDPEGEVRKYVVEKAMRDCRLRNILLYFEPGIERVQLVEPNGTYPPFGVHEPMAIEFDGETYQVTAEVVEEASLKPSIGDRFHSRAEYTARLHQYRGNGFSSPRETSGP